MIVAFPPVLLLASDDEDLLAWAGFAIAGGVEGSDVGQAGLRGRHQAEVGDVPALAATGTAWGLAEYHDVLGKGAGDVHQ